MVEDSAGEIRNEEYKIGLHDWMDDLDNVILSWKSKLGRHFIVEQVPEEFSVQVEDKWGCVHNTIYRLELNRKVDLMFTQVKNVTHLFPLNEEDVEQVVYDKFLQDLLERRSSTEFQNIVFSIQKQQGEIIQTPFEKNMIIQGCAGSGKSMIMLHRLPILMYDNKEELKFNNMYTITPSKVYIQMASNMLAQLEIADLRMGTMRDYLDICIEKYRYTAKDYGKEYEIVCLDKTKEEYIYSDRCIADIKDEIESSIDESNPIVDDGLKFFGIEKNIIEPIIPIDRITAYLLNIQKIINKNSGILKIYFFNIRHAIDRMNNLKFLLINRKNSIENKLRQDKDESNRRMKKYIAEISLLNPEKNKRAFENKIADIEKERALIEHINDKFDKLYDDKDYFDKLNEIASRITSAVSLFPNLGQEYLSEKIEIAQLTYKAIGEIEHFIDKYYYIYCELDEIEEKYTNLVPSLRKYNEDVAEAIEQLENTSLTYLPSNYYLQMLKKKQELQNINIELPRKVFQNIAYKIGVFSDGEQKMFDAAPYLFLQILYQFKGIPNAKFENLITIDEAQGFTRNEYELIKNVNGNKIIFNLFGDEKQHIEGTKGITSWEEIMDLEDFVFYDMRDNYRNAKQITNYCNSKFNLNMRAINLDGTGYYEAESAAEFMEIFNKQLTSAKQGLCAIIVKDLSDAKLLTHSFKQYKSKLNDLSEQDAIMNFAKWNIITVATSKGLEFTSVIALMGNMTRNERYIACTRALDELIVCDIPLEKIMPSNIYSEKIQSFDDKPNVNMENIVTIKRIFTDKDLETIDLIDETGEFWILGNRRRIGDIVENICKEYDIKATYSHSKVTNGKPGWVIRICQNRV